MEDRTLKTENPTPAGALEILGLERAALDSWPALESDRDGLWLRRAANGYSKRSNSITVLGRPMQSLSDALASGDRWLRERGLPVVYRLVERLAPVQLDERLQARGDRLVDPSEVWTLALDASPTPASTPAVTVTDPASWLSIYGHCADKPAHQLNMHQRLLARLQLPAGWLAIHADGEPVGCVLMVVQDRLAGIFDLVIAPQYRRRGLATTLMAGALAWAVEHGADTAYLQVVTANEAARRLYAALGFKHRYRYWYRVGRPSTR